MYLGRHYERVSLVLAIWATLLLAIMVLYSQLESKTAPLLPRER
jgi:hypothetical protein